MDVVVYLHPNSILNTTKMKTFFEKNKKAGIIPRLSLQNRQIYIFLKANA